VSVEPRELKARYPGVCKECGRDIKEGQKIWWAPGYVYHREHFPFAQGEGPEYYEGWDDYEGPSNYVEYEDARTEANRLVSGFNADGSRGDADLGIEGRG
jgi:hypothetical protein